MSAPYVQTFTPVIGSLSCNAKCPYCCSAMTYGQGLTFREPDYDWGSFDIAAEIARNRQCITAFITSKGEPTLYPATVQFTIDRLRQQHRFPLIELQTNGIRIPELTKDGWLQRWKNSGLNLMCISAVHWETGKNQEVFGKYYPDLSHVVACCRGEGIRVRISCVMIKDFVDDYEDMIKMRNACTKWGADQLTIRPVTAPSKCLYESEKWRIDWIKNNAPDLTEQEKIFQWLEHNSKDKRSLAHGAKVYSVQLEENEPEVNVCLSNCFTPSVKDEEIRQIIWFPNGRITDNWDHEGFIIL